MIPVVSKVAVAAALLGVSLSSNAVEITYEGSTAGSFSDATTACVFTQSSITSLRTARPMRPNPLMATLVLMPHPPQSVR